MRMSFIVTVDARGDVHPKIHARILETALEQWLEQHDVGIASEPISVRPVVKTTIQPRKKEPYPS